MTSILIAEDERRIAAFLQKGLRANGFTTTVVDDGITAFDYACTDDFDMLILDIGLPGMDGFTLLHRLRDEQYGIPVIIVTARSSVHDTVAGLEGGAADYVCKPFRFEELLARIRLRIHDRQGPDSTVLHYGGLALNLRTRRACADGHAVELTAREFRLAETLIRNPDQVLSREQLLSRVWDYDFDPTSNIVDVYIGYLRAKIGPTRIQTVRRMGYRLTDPDTKT